MGSSCLGRHFEHILLTPAFFSEPTPFGPFWVFGNHLGLGTCRRCSILMQRSALPQWASTRYFPRCLRPDDGSTGPAWPPKDVGRTADIRGATDRATAGVLWFQAALVEIARSLGELQPRQLLPCFLELMLFRDYGSLFECCGAWGL